MKRIKSINIIGAGFVGLTLASVVSKNVEKVIVYDTDKNKINSLKEGKSPVHEPGLKFNENIEFTSNISDCEGEIYFICVGTPNINGTQNAEFLYSSIYGAIMNCPNATIIIKSTTTPDNLIMLRNKLFRNKYGAKLITNPEFLAEGTAVYDLKHQQVLIIGCEPTDEYYAKELLMDIYKGMYNSVSILGLCEAMVCKYYLNSFKAMKVIFNNEFNNFCNIHGLDFKAVINTVKFDNAIGLGFDKPGVAFGGSCFPKDTLAIGNKIKICKFINERNEGLINEFVEYLYNLINSVIPHEKKVLFGGKSFKSNTNDTRDSVAIKVKYRLLERIPDLDITFYDKTPELSDHDLKSLKKNPTNFDLVVLFNDLPDLVEIFEGHSIIINTRYL